MNGDRRATRLRDGAIHVPNRASLRGRGCIPADHPASVDVACAPLDAAGAVIRAWPAWRSWGWTGGGRGRNGRRGSMPRGRVPAGRRIGRRNRPMACSTWPTTSCSARWSGCNWTAPGWWHRAGWATRWRPGSRPFPVCMRSSWRMRTPCAWRVRAAMRRPGRTASSMRLIASQRSHGTAGAYAGLLQQSQRDGRPVVALSRRFDRADGSFGGVVEVVVDLSDFRTLVSAARSRSAMARYRCGAMTGRCWCGSPPPPPRTRTRCSRRRSRRGGACGRRRRTGWVSRGSTPTSTSNARR